MFHLLLLVAASSSTFEDLNRLDDRITAVSPDAEQVDKRLKLAACPESPIIAPPAGGSVIVRCPALGWRLRVPVNTTLQKAESAEIVIRKGEMVECVSGGRGFAVSTTMIALEDAAVGQAVRVKSSTNAGPSSTIIAVATARGQASF